MKKIRLCTHRSVSTDILRAVQKLGLVEFVDITGKDPSLIQKEKKSFEFDYVSNRLDFVVTFLSKFEKKGGLRTMIESDRVRTTGTKLYKTANSFYYNEIIDAAQETEEKINNANARIKKLKDEKKTLQLWENVEINLNTPLETHLTKAIYISGKKGVFYQLEGSLTEKNILYHITDPSITHAFLVFFKENKEDVEKILRNLSIDISTLHKRRGTPKEEIGRITRAVEKEEKKIVRRTNRAEELTKYLPQLKIVSDYIYWQKNKHNLLSNAVASNSVVVFEGWCPEKKLALLEEKISNKSDFYSLDVIEAEDGEIPPVEIKNNSLIKPFESITRLYGLPGYKDLDPTLFLAGFFFIFFGLCLTDVGYGIILFLITAGILAFYRVPKETEGFLYLLMFGGLGSVLVGLIFGGYFGFDLSLLPAWTEYIQIFDPIKNPIPVFVLALSFGVFQIMIGLFLKILREKKNGNFLGGILDQVPWLLIFTALILWGLNKTGVLPGNSTLYVYGIYVGLASLILTQGRKEKNIFMKFFKG
ncbi:MAG: hypothetical protein KAS07_00700, partial [Candidatus Pacebacteria bacterium]|nr:hypothetical protein [Candidatus Paceibacterota bacterium]